MTLVFEREGCKPRADLTPAQLKRELSRLRGTFASLTRDDGDYVQVAGSPGGLTLERHVAKPRTQYRAYQDIPVVPFEDGTELVCSSGRIPMRKGEWFSLVQVVEVFVAFSRGEPFPGYVRWRDVTEQIFPRG